MHHQRHDRVREVFHAVCDLDVASRLRVLEARCGDDAELRREVLSLLAHVERPAIDLDAHGIVGIEEMALETPLPERIGRYRVLGQLGEGGMGLVLLAQQERPERRVALKVIRPGIVTEGMLRRFELESEVLGRLRHPCIAQIYEAGVAESEHGPQPYFAMEYVDGAPLLAAADREGWRDRERLAAIAQIADAVQHAHQRGVIHRDLKPANILVCETGPKILDFGIARTTDAERHATQATAAGQLLGTITSMSPEQLSGDPNAVDTRSDVYALGVLAYQLLTGRAAYETETLPLHEAIRRVAQEPPVPVTSRRPDLRGDIATIIETAMAKEPARRYSSASALAEDIRRHLADEPIAARRASTVYQLRKFAKRNVVLVGGAAATLVALVLGIAGTAYGLVAARGQRDAARAAVTFLSEDLLGQAMPVRQPDRALTLRAALDNASSRIGERFRDQPLAEATIRQMLGDAYRRLGEYAAAGPHIEAAVALRTVHLGPNDPETLRSRNTRGLWLADQKRAEEAIAEHRDVLERRRRLLGREHLDTITSATNLAMACSLHGAYDEAERLLIETLEIRERRYGLEDAASVVCLSNLASLHMRQRRFDDAARVLERTTAVSDSVLGPDHPDALLAKHNFGSLLIERQRYDEAQIVLAEVLEGRRRILGPDHTITLATQSNLASAYLRDGDLDAAEPLFLGVVDARTRVLGADALDTGFAMCNLGRLYVDMQTPERAEGPLRDGLAVLRARLPEGDWKTGRAMTTLGRCLVQLGQADEAATLLAGGGEILDAAGHPGAAEAWTALAALHDAEGRPEAARLLRERLETGGEGGG